MVPAFAVLLMTWKYVGIWDIVDCDAAPAVPVGVADDATDDATGGVAAGEEATDDATGGAAAVVCFFFFGSFFSAGSAARVPTLLCLRCSCNFFIV